MKRGRPARGAPNVQGKEAGLPDERIGTKPDGACKL